LWRSSLSPNRLPRHAPLVAVTRISSSNAPLIPDVVGYASLYRNPLDPIKIPSGRGRFQVDYSLRRVLVQLGAERASQLSWQETAARKTVLVYEQILLKRVDTMRRDN
jgi:hypothetical protein